MVSKHHGLPPLKRFRLMQKQQQEQAPDGVKESFSLPTKKRRESRDAVAIATYPLPTKKRVWALQHNLSPIKTLLAFDLNDEYKPSFDEEKIFFERDEEKGVEVEEKQIPDEYCCSQATEFREQENDEIENGDGNDGNGIESDIAAKVEEKEIPAGISENQATGIGEEGKDEIENGGDDDDDGIECAVCRSTDGDPSDPIVFCDGCDLMAHTTCYGNPLLKGVPEGDWFCALCLASKSSQSKKHRALSCCLCRAKGGALKPTTNGQWAHIVCAFLVPEVFFEDPVGREGINCSIVPARRWEQNCYVCNSASGCAIDCSEPECNLSFHVTCGLKEELCIEYREGKNKAAVVAGFCKDHTELWKKQQQTGKFKIVAREEHK